MSTFGSAFRVTTYGESHCKSVGCIIDGVPPGLALSESDIQVQLTRRRPGQSNLTTPRNEKDSVAIQSGCEFGYTLGTPICLTVQNQDQRPHDYSETDFYPRPSHADWTYLQKYGVKASSGGGRSSARETIGRVAAGAVAEKYLAEVHGIEIVAFVSGVGPIEMAGDGPAFHELLATISRDTVDQTLVRCPDPAVSAQMEAEIVACSQEKNSTGGTVTCVVRNVPAGLGEPCFDKLEAKLAHAMLSIPATKGFEIGSGFRGTQLRGSEHNDPFVADGRGGLRTTSNHSGGVQGGISNGESIYFRVAFKPPATISQDQQTATYAGEGGTLAARGRHDPCVVPRAVPIVEAMAALTVMDALLVQNGRAATSARLAPVPAELKGIKPV
ncbi:bifunctional chorismate synthase/riboflavin reductase [NAD(P)H] aro2 [Coemansia spiralis]|nr:bifunctional chorismate synthase/riboflavin reductase [NAD(P)H] aro2 [Coemansia spiralis]